MRYESGAAGRRAEVDSPSGDAGRLGRLAAAPAGRALRDRLAAQGLLWPLVGARQPPPRSAWLPQSTAERALAKGGFTGNVLGRLVTSDSDVCIDGFPRSANSYTVAAFRQWNREASVAHHMHAAFQIRRAVRFGVPCCVLVRRPLDAVASTLVMDRERISDNACYLSFIRLHRRIAPVRDRFVLCRFEELVEDPSIAVRRLNERFGTSFTYEPMTPEVEAATLTRIRGRRPRDFPEFLAAAPSEAKEGRKKELRSRLAGNPLLREAEAAYAAVTGETEP